MVKQPRTPKVALTPAQVEALDLDDDGHAGGSRPRKIGEHEFTAICAEAWEAYDYQAERVRFDTLGRRWQFRPDKNGVNSVLSLEVKRLGEVRGDTISTAVLASELGRDMIADVVKTMTEAFK